MIFKDTNSRCQVYLIDYQAFKDARIQICNLTKFVFVNPLKSKRAVEVVQRRIDIFTNRGTSAQTEVHFHKQRYIFTNRGTFSQT